VAAPRGEPLALPDFLGRPGPTTWHRLAPLTKLVLAICTAVAAIALGGIGGPLILVLVAVLVPARLAGVLRRLLRLSLMLSLPIALSALLVNLFFYPDGERVLFQLGPITATVEGLWLALQTLARIMAISGAITLFYLTTRPSDLVLDLEQRGVPARVGFVANASVQTVPAMLDRATAIIAAQRARGLDTQAGLWRRFRGLVPIVGPVVLGAIGQVEERTMALEARGFTRPGRRTLLWAPTDSARQRAARWAMVLGVVGLVIASATGSLAWIPGIG
jgi:energy-coupling factor transport system permease protein